MAPSLNSEEFTYKGNGSRMDKVTAWQPRECRFKTHTGDHHDSLYDTGDLNKL